MAEQRIPNPQVAGSSPSRRVDGGDDGFDPDADRKEAGRLGFGLYKYGQGYYVRLLTAIMVGTLFLAGAGWAWKHLSAIAVPTPTWRVTVADGTGSLSAGETIELQRVAGEARASIGTARVVSFSPFDASNPGAGTAIVGEIKTTDNQSVLDANRVRVAGADPAGQPTFLGTITAASGIEAFQRQYLQGGVAGIILLVGGALVYFYCGLNRRSVDYLIATDGEMKKVNWSTRQNILNSTYVVIAATFIVAGFIFVADVVLQGMSQGIGLLGGR